MAGVRKTSPSNTPDWRPWVAARFQTEGARDEFVRAVADAHDVGWGAEVVPGDGLCAQVRWRPGRFLGLNDVAYSHGGRIVVSLPQRWVM